MYISKVEYRTSPEPCGKEFTDKVRCNDSRFCTSSEFQICLGPIRGQNVGSIVASRSKTSKQNLTIGAVAETVVSSVVVGVGLSLPLGNMDGSGGVGDVPSGTSISSSNSRDGGGGNANGGEGGGGGDLGVAGDNWGNSMDGVGDNRRSDGMVGVANNRGNSVVGRVDTVVGLSLSLTLSVVATVVATKTVSVRPQTVSSVSVSTVVVGISLSLSLPPAVVAVGPVAQTVVAKTVVAKTIAVAVVGIGISLRLSGSKGRKGKCQDSLHLSSATFCDKPSHVLCVAH